MVEVKRKQSAGHSSRCLALLALVTAGALFVALSGNDDTPKEVAFLPIRRFQKKQETLQIRQLREKQEALQYQKPAKIPTQESLQYQKPAKIPARSQFTLDEFEVNGVNLASYGYEPEAEAGDTVRVLSLKSPYSLYDDFFIGDMLAGGEGWFEMVDLHMKLQHPSLSFYSDKVAAKRWMTAMGIPRPDTTALVYTHELAKQTHEEQYQALLALLPEKKSYVAKPTNRACSSGVWVVQHDPVNDKTTMGYGGEYMDADYEPAEIAERLAKDINRQDESCGDWAMWNMKPGFIIEDRFTAFDSDRKPAMEFKVFTIWGRVWLANWRRGNRRPGLVYRNGTVVDWTGKYDDYGTLPDWVAPYWGRVVEIAERLARHKDMYRVDMFVGVPAGHPALREGASKQEQIDAVQVRVSETEFAPSTHLRDPGLFEEASRLWMAGYKMGIHKLVPNTEVPQAFLQKGFLSEEDAQALAEQGPSFFTTKQ